MEEEVIHDIHLLLSENIYKDSEEWNEFKSKFENADYANALFQIVISPQSSHSDKILGISVLLNFKIIPSTEIVTQLSPLLFNETYQQLISTYIVTFCDKEFLYQTLFPTICEEVQSQDEYCVINGLVLCFYESIRIHKLRNETILQIMFQIIAEKVDLPIQCRKKALESIILQLNLIDIFNEKESLDQDMKNIMTLFMELPVDDNNFPLFEYLLYFIKESIPKTHYDLSVYDHEIPQKIEQILDFLVGKAPLDPDNIVFSTILFYLVEILEAKKYEVPFEKIYSLMIIGQNQLEALQAQVDYFFGVFMYDTDDFGIDYDEIDDENSDEDSDDGEIDKNAFKIFRVDFADYSRTLSDSQSSLINYLSHQSDEYLIESIQNCLSTINDSIYTNLTMLQYFMKLKACFPIVLDPQQFNCYENPILQSMLIEFCQMRAILSKDYDESASTIYIPFLNEFNYQDFFKALIEADDSVLALCAFNLITSTPREYINQYIFETILKRALLLIIDFSKTEVRTYFIEHMFAFYLNQGETLIKDEEKESKKIIYNDDPLVRRYICDSIFTFSDTFLEAFKEDSQSFFGEVLHQVFESLKDDPCTLKYLSELIYYFAGKNMNQYLDRFRTEDSPAVNMSKYDLFFEEIIDFSPGFIMDFFSDPNLIECGYSLFAYSFINIDLNNETYSNFVDTVYQFFLNDHAYIERNKRNPEIFDMITRIFIRNEKYLHIDEFCCKYIFSNIDHIRSLIYQLSFILINKLEIYSQDTILSIVKILLRTFFEEVSKENPYIDLIFSIGVIFARLSLSFSKEYFEGLLNHFPYNKKTTNVDLFLHYLFINIKDRTYEKPELIQKLFIAMYYLLADHDDAQKKAQFILYKLVCKMNSTFTENSEIEIPLFLNSTFGLVQEPIFYEDNEFLIHPLISSKICALIESIVDNPLNQEVGETFMKFGDDFPDL